MKIEKSQKNWFFYASSQCFYLLSAIVEKRWWRVTRGFKSELREWCFSCLIDACQNFKKIWEVINGSSLNFQSNVHKKAREIS